MTLPARPCPACLETGARYGCWLRCPRTRAWMRAHPSGWLETDDGAGRCDDRWLQRDEDLRAEQYADLAGDELARKEWK